MKTRKALFASAAAVALVAAMVPAAALAADVTDISQTSTANTTVKYVVGSSYTWTVPSEVTFTEEGQVYTREGDVTVSKNVIPAKKSVKVSLSSDNPFTVSTHEGAKRAFTVSKGADANLKANDTILTVASGTAADKQELTFKLTTLASNEALQAGDYTGTVKYQAEVVADSSN